MTDQLLRGVRELIQALPPRDTKAASIHRARGRGVPNAMPNRKGQDDD